MIKRVLTFAATLTIAAACTPIGTQRGASAAQQDQNFQVGFTNSLDNHNRTYKEMISSIEDSEARVQGYESSLIPKTKEDPQYVLMQKRQATLSTDTQDVRSRHNELLAWAQGVTAPTQADVQTISQRANSLAQDMVAIVTAYSKLEMDYMGLKSRHSR